MEKVRAETDRNVAATVVGQRENELDLAGEILAARFGGIVQRTRGKQ